MKFNIEKCGSCGACISVCPNNSLELTESIIIVNENNCNDCGRCTIICPLGALLSEVEVNSQNFQNFRKSKISDAPNTQCSKGPKNLTNFWRLKNEI